MSGSDPILFVSMQTYLLEIAPYWLCRRPRGQVCRSPADSEHAIDQVYYQAPK